MRGINGDHVSHCAAEKSSSSERNISLFFFSNVETKSKMRINCGEHVCERKIWISGKLFFVSWKCWWTQWRWMIIKIDKNYRTYKILLYYSSFSFFFWNEWNRSNEKKNGQLISIRFSIDSSLNIINISKVSYNYFAQILIFFFQLWNSMEDFKRYVISLDWPETQFNEF